VSFSLSVILLLATPAANDTAGLGARTEPEGRFVPVENLQWAQVRIQKRIIIRVPRRRPTPAASLARESRQAAPLTFKEKKIGKCMPMNSILGVQMFGGRNLDLITRDRKRIRARLEKKCQARSFYSGFYMEKSGDGKICADRDVLHSRTGSKCEIDRFRELVPE
jgi:hypothetical protein